MTDDERNHEALFRHAILGDVLSRNLRRGQLRPALKQLAQQTYQDHHGRIRRIAYKTLEEWFYKYRNCGFDALKPRPRKDRHRSRVLTEDLQQLILDMKREDPGRSAHLILRKLELAGRIRAGQASVASVQRLLHRLVRNDSTVQWRGVFYEVPPYLRRQRVRLRYALLDSTRVSVLDGVAEIPLRPVQPVDNSHRSRTAAATAVAGESRKTGLNVAELILARAAGIPAKGGSDE